MKYLLLSLIISTFLISKTYSYNDDGKIAKEFLKTTTQTESNILTSFFKDLSGTWIASPTDSTFISRLEFRRSNEQFLIPVSNKLMSKTGELFAEYEGVYIYNPVDESISFTTVNAHEIHTGISWIEGDTLFHKATISGPGNIQSYTSAIIKKPDDTLQYFANYSQTKEYPLLEFHQPLIYRKEQAVK